jgi:murein L,D-transpeptidase YcbB/YkuD
MRSATERRRRGATAPAAIALLATAWLGCAGGLRAEPTRPASVAAEIQALLERDDPAQPLGVDGAEIASTLVLPEFYGRRRFEPAWTDPRDHDALLAAIQASWGHGLDPEDYHAAILTELRARAARDAHGAAAFDLLLSDAALRLAYHLSFGKVDAATLDPSWNLAHPLPAQDLPGALEAALAAHRVGETLQELAPRGWLYEGLKRGLAELRALDAAGGWPAVGEGPSLRRGDSGARVAALRARLAASGELRGDADATSLAYDAALAEAVKRFQTRHGLDADGVVGGRTLAALDVPVAARVDQLRVNLERARWVLQDLPGRFLMVNVPGYEAFYFDDRELLWRARVQVGQAMRRTPIFRSEMTHLVFNPTWTVPPGILAKDILSAGAGAPAVVKRKGLRILDDAGAEVDPAAVEWTRYDAAGFPYTLRQDPGPTNALGRVKFMFPNRHMVYLHDTPSKQLFERSERAFSSGCIRIEKPLELAERVLADPVRWSRDGIEAAIASGETQTVFLADPVPVLLLYWTAVPTRAGGIRFFRDVYGRDPEVLAALGRPFEFRRSVREEVTVR